MSGAARDVAAMPAKNRMSVAAPNRLAPARPLEAGMRRTMESRFGHDFSDVRVHAGSEAARAADALDARAYAIDSEIVFGAGEYQPQSPRGQLLLAHELAHVVQRRQQGPGDGAETRADHAAAQVAHGASVSPAQLGGAGPGVHRQPKGDDTKTADAAAAGVADIKPFTLPLGVLLGQFPQLQAPAVLGRPKAAAPIIPMPQLSLGAGAAAPLGGAPFRLPPVASLPAPGPLAPLAQPFSPGPTPAGSAGAAAAPDLPSRVGVTDVWKLSLGLRFGLPKAREYVPGTKPELRSEPGQIPGSGPSALAVSDYQFELLDMSMSGKVPHGFDAVDKGDLIKASFGIVSTYLAPQLFAKLAQKVAGKPGADYKFDLTIDGSFKGGGITFEVPLGKPKKAHKAAVESP